MSDFKDSLINKALGLRRFRLAEKDQSFTENVEEGNQATSKYDKFCSFANYENYKLIEQKKTFAEKFKLKNPFFPVHDQIASATSMIAGKMFINFSSYNYLNLNGDPRVALAAKQAIDDYGTSASASRLVSGERPVHSALERAIADMHGVDDALVFVSGYTTNVTTIGYLFGPQDLIVHDELIHDSALQGIKLSGAFRQSFPHNDWQSLDELLRARRHQFERVLVIVEGIYSMDGDYPDLPQFISIKKRHKAFLMVDEAHSIGVMGAKGYGIGEHFGVNADDVDIWMGTLSKTLAGCGGYIAGCHALVEHLKFAAPGFLYSVGMSPPLAAAALKSLQIMQAEPERIVLLRERTKQFLDEAKYAGLDVGLSKGFNIIPVICGSSRKAVQLANTLHERGINVQPIIYPAVPDNQARLRFFMSCAHTEHQITTAVKEIAHAG